MKPGGGGKKGGAFERRICVTLSLWVSKGASRDLYWRSAGSGGRATQLNKTREKKVDIGNGDISALDEFGQALTDLFTVECKCYGTNKLGLTEACFGNPRILREIWKQASDACCGTEPFVIVKENRRDEMVLTTRRGLEILNEACRKPLKRTCSFHALGAHGVLLRDVMVRVRYEALQRRAKAVRRAKRKAKK